MCPKDGNSVWPGSLLIPAGAQEQQFPRGQPCLRQPSSSLCQHKPFLCSLETERTLCGLNANVAKAPLNAGCARYCPRCLLRVGAAPVWARCLISSCCSESPRELGLNVASSDVRGRCAPVPRMCCSPHCVAPRGFLTPPRV